VRSTKLHAVLLDGVYRDTKEHGYGDALAFRALGHRGGSALDRRRAKRAIVPR
jgi:hypothetical protein